MCVQTHLWRVDLPGAGVLEKRDYERQLVANLPILSVDRGVHVLASGDTNVRRCGGKSW